MYQSTFQKLLALFISSSILITSVPVYAGETTSPTEPVMPEVFGETDVTADNSDEDISGLLANGLLADEDIAGESLADTPDEYAETPDGPDAGSAASDDSNIHDSDIFGNDDEEAWPKRLSFAHLFHEDANDPAYDALRKELDEVFRNAQLQDITELPESYSLVSLPVGGEGAGGSADRSAPIGADQGKDVLMPVYNQGDTMQTCWSFTGTGIIESYLIRNHYDKLRGQGIELSKWQVPAAASMSVSSDTVIGGYSADPSQYGEGIGYTLGDGGSPTPNVVGHDGYRRTNHPRGRFSLKVIKHDKIQTVLTTTDHTDRF